MMREYRTPEFCECDHDKDDHVDGGFWSRRECEICKCPNISSPVIAVITTLELQRKEDVLNAGKQIRV